MNNKLLIFTPNSNAISETFIRAHIENLPFDVIPRYGVTWGLLDQSGAKIFPIMFWLGRFIERVKPKINKVLFNYFLERHLLKIRPDAILAEFGTTGAWIIEASAKKEIPLFVIFHGFDASIKNTLSENKEGYEKIFQSAAGIVAVSKAMRQKLIELGASAEKIIWSPCGVDPSKFQVGDPSKSKPVLFGVGRFVEKKAPYLTILAFKNVAEKHPEAQLRLAGDGPLLGPCKRLIQALQLSNSVILLGSCDHTTVAKEMQSARAFVQHSLVAENGDSEGTPVAVIEAQMCGIPVISTKHAGIPDIVIDGETGFLVDEADVNAMAEAMISLVSNPELAYRLGAAGRKRAESMFKLSDHINDISKLINSRVWK